MRPTLITVLRGSRAALWAALAALALLQVSYAGHAHEHAVEEVGESCDICLKLSENKTPISGKAAEPALPCAVEDYAAIPRASANAVAARPTHIRGPPPLP